MFCSANRSQSPFRSASGISGTSRYGIFAAMYVCACHGFKEKQVSQAVAEGPCSVAEVYRRLGETPQCGKCVCSVVDMVRCARGGADETVPALQYA